MLLRMIGQIKVSGDRFRCVFSAECTIGMVWGLTALKRYGNKALWQ